MTVDSKCILKENNKASFKQSIHIFDNHTIYIVAALYCGLLMALKLVSLSFYDGFPAERLWNIGGNERNYSQLLPFVRDAVIEISCFFYCVLRSLETFSIKLHQLFWK